MRQASLVAIMAARRKKSTMRPALYSQDDIIALAAALPQWRLSDDNKALHARLKFRDFKTAFAFMTKMAEQAEALDHHPDWSNSYQIVKIRLTTHDVRGLTELDKALALAMTEAARDMGAVFMDSHS